MDESTQQTQETPKSIHWINQLNPAVPKHWLLLVAGLMWSGVGILLITLALTWMAKGFSTLAVLLGLLGIVISVIANRFMFTRLALKNINRILASNDKACLFSFQAWTGYVIIAVMMTLGITLRNSAIPKVYLATVYIAIGGALLLASFNYYRYFFRTDFSGTRP